MCKSVKIYLLSLIIASIFVGVDASGLPMKSCKRGIDIKKVMDYKMPHVIARYCKDYKVSNKAAKRYEIELKRYLILAADDDEELDMFSAEVDNLWHTFLLFTKEYQEFCNVMFGKFIHHAPIVDQKIVKK